MTALPIIDPQCGFALLRPDHVCTRNTGAPIHPGDDCHQWARALEQLEASIESTVAGDVHLVSSDVLVDVVEAALAPAGVRSERQQASLLRVAAMLTNPMCDWAASVVESWRQRPCASCETPIGLDGGERCGDCLRVAALDAGYCAADFEDVA
jgi:hypothetical protein